MGKMGKDNHIARKSVLEFLVRENHVADIAEDDAHFLSKEYRYTFSPSDVEFYKARKDDIIYLYNSDLITKLSVKEGWNDRLSEYEGEGKDAIFFSMYLEEKKEQFLKALLDSSPTGMANNDQDAPLDLLEKHIFLQRVANPEFYRNLERDQQILQSRLAQRKNGKRRILVRLYEAFQCASEVERRKVELDLNHLCDFIKLGIPTYLPIAKIGSGTRDVYKVWDEQKQDVRVLKLNKLEWQIPSRRAQEVFQHLTMRELSEREVAALKDLNHENLARLWDYGVWHDYPEGHERSYIIEEYVQGKTLEELVQQGPFSADKFLLVFTPLLRICKYLEEKGYVHRDIKPRNIIIASDFRSVKLTDLQTAVRADEAGQYLGDSFGSLAVTAPEVILGGPASFASDIYSLGVCMYYALERKMPFDYGEGGESREALQLRINEKDHEKKIRNMRLNFYHNDRPNEIISLDVALEYPLVASFLRFNPEDRPQIFRSDDIGLFVEEEISFDALYSDAIKMLSKRKLKIS